jgi:hypothetical protein
MLRYALSCFIHVWETLSVSIGLFAGAIFLLGLDVVICAFMSRTCMEMGGVGNALLTGIDWIINTSEQGGIVRAIWWSGIDCLVVLFLVVVIPVAGWRLLKLSFYYLNMVAAKMPRREMTNRQLASVKTSN